MTTAVSVVLVLVFALQCVNDVYLHSPAEMWLALTPECFGRGWLWQLITFQFLHANLLHLCFNLISFWWVGHFVESVLGKRRFLVALLGCGAIGGAFQALLMVLFPARFGVPVVGASAGVCGILAIFGLLERDSVVRLNFILPVRAITIVWVLGAVSLFFIVVPTPREFGMAHAAHLGGLLAGLAWVKLGWHRDYVRLPWESWLDRWRERWWFRSRRPPRDLVKTTAFRTQRWPRSTAEPPADLPSEEFISREVDPILDKISAHGIQSLTDRERRILEAARNRMAKR